MTSSSPEKTATAFYRSCWLLGGIFSSSLPSSFCVRIVSLNLFWHFRPSCGSERVCVASEKHHSRECQTNVGSTLWYDCENAFGKHTAASSLCHSCFQRNKKQQQRQQQRNRNNKKKLNYTQLKCSTFRKSTDWVTPAASTAVVVKMALLYVSDRT